MNQLINVFYRQDIFVKKETFHAHTNYCIRKKQMDQNWHIPSCDTMSGGTKNHASLTVKKLKNIHLSLDVNNQTQNGLEQTCIHRTSRKGYEKNIDCMIAHDYSKIDFIEKNRRSIQDAANIILLIKLNKKNNYTVASFSKNTNTAENITEKFFLVKYSDEAKTIKGTPDFFFHNNNDLKKLNQWKKAISQQNLFFVFQKQKTAEIQVIPENLRPIYIKIKMHNDQATVDFMSHHFSIAPFLYNAIPFLRNSLEKNGIHMHKIHIHSLSDRDRESMNIRSVYKNKYIPEKDLEKNINQINYHNIDAYA